MYVQHKAAYAFVDIMCHLVLFVLVYRTEFSPLVESIGVAFVSVCDCALYYSKRKKKRRSACEMSRLIVLSIVTYKS